MAASTEYVNLPDGSDWYYSLDGSSYTMFGVLNGDTQATWNYDKNDVEFHDGQKIASYRNQTMAVNLVLADLNPQALSDMTGGMITKTDTAGSPFADAPDQTIAAGWSNMQPINLAPTTAGGVSVVCSVVPTMTSVTGATAGALAAGDDYYLVTDPNSFSGFSIILDTDGSAGLVTTEVVTVDYASVTPVATTSLSAGSPSYTPSTVALRGVQAGSGTTIDIKAVNVDGGSIDLGFKGTTSSGTDEWTFSCTGILDSSADDGSQLFTITRTL